MRSIDQEVGQDIDAVEVAGEAEKLYVRERPFPDILEMLAGAVAGFERDDWTP